MHMKSTEIYGRMVEEYIAGISYPAVPERLYDPIRYTMENGGKRLRPLLVLLSCGLWKNDVSEALPAAAAIEMFHNFTLIHDDIMDNAPLRRGRPSVYNRWNANIAILSGDSLMICSYGVLSRCGGELFARIMSYFNEAAVKVCEGQQYDMDFEERQDVSLDEHVAMIELKTSALFVGAVCMGAVVGGASEQDIEHLRRFAIDFGVAFQMQDDILDSYGDARLGKSVGGDILEGKKTYLKMLAMESADAAELQLLNTLHLDDTVDARQKIERILAIYDKYGVRQRAEEAVNERFKAAVSALDELSADKERIAEFRDFAMGLLGRNK